MKRFGQIIRIKPEKFAEYKKYHAATWPEVLSTIKKCRIRNYSIYHKNGQLFAYFEYTGDNFKKDMEKMAADPKTQEWWAIMKPMQETVQNEEKIEGWIDMEEVFHTD